MHVLNCCSHIETVDIRNRVNLFFIVRRSCVDKSFDSEIS